MSTERGKEIHYRVMRILGYMTVGISAWAAWVAFGGGRGLPDWMYGRWGAAAAAPRPAVRRPAAGLVRWRAWDRAALREAREKDRLIFLLVGARWSRESRVLEETAFADPGLARSVAAAFVAIRVDADERPDLARRYVERGVPTVALLLPTGEVLAASVARAPDLLRAWAEALERSFRKRREEVGELRLSALAARVEAPAAAPRAAPDPVRALAWARERLEGEWDAGTAGFGRGARTPRLETVAGLEALESSPWARDLREAAARGALSLEDPVWGGFYRGAAGPGWEHPEHDKRLEDQAWAVLALEELQPAAAARAVEYVDAFLRDPAGGWWTGQAGEALRPDGLILEGDYLFAQDAARRKALGPPAVDRRHTAWGEALMARALLKSRLPAAARRRAAAVKALERYAAAARAPGEVPHSLSGGVAGLLEDEAALGRAWLAAGTPAGRDRALAVASWLEARLLDRSQGVYLDRPRLGELPEGLDRAAVPSLNAQAWTFLTELAAALPAGHPRRTGVAARAARLRSWLLTRPQALDPLTLAALTRGG